MDVRPAPLRGSRPSRVVRALVTAACGLGPALLAGCAARPDRFAAFRDPPTVARPAPVASPPDVRRGELTGRGGYASLGARVRLRDDTPPLTPIVEAERAASMPPVYVLEQVPSGPCGPEGAGGAYPLFADPGCVTPFFAPVGAVSPGYRPPFDPRPSPFASAYHAGPAADVYHHRPGLSTGSGIYGRGLRH